MTRLAPGAPLYLCGPLPMIEAAIALAKRLDWPQGRLHFEIFTAPEEKSGDASFEVELKGSGARLRDSCRQDHPRRADRGRRRPDP